MRLPCCRRQRSTPRGRAQEHWQVVKDRSEITDTPPEAVAQAEALYMQFKAQAETALYGALVPGSDQLGLFGREQTLREKMGWSPTDQRMIRPSDEPTLALVQFDWFDVLGEGLIRNVDLRRQKWTIKQRELELVSARNQILPQLDLVGTYRFLGVGDEFANADRSGLAFPNPGSSAIEELTGGDYQEVGARLEYTPQALGKRRALNNIQSARLGIRKGVEELREKEIAMVHELSSTWRQMESHFILIDSRRKELQANETQIRIFNDKIDGDVGEIAALLDQLLRAEERKARAQLLYYQSVCEYNKSLVNMHYIKGSILDLNNISLGEGAWVEKAYWDADERARERAAGTYIDYGYTRPSVVSLGAAAFGGPTESNISDQGPYYEQATPVPAEEVEATEGDAEANDGQQEPGKLQEMNTPVAVNGTSAVRTASAQQFNLGQLGNG